MSSMYSAAVQRMRTVWLLAPLLLALFAYMAGWAATIPVRVDVLLAALCPGQSECSEVIALSGLETTIIGVGAMLLAPILGALSDSYGRKPVFLMVLISPTAPTLILVYSRQTMYVYAWWVLQLFGVILKDAGLLTITFAFVADIVPNSKQRALAFGIAISSTSLGVLGGTLVTQVLKTDQIFAFSALLQITSAVILKVFVIESHPKHIQCAFFRVSAPEDDIEKPLIPKKDAKTIIMETIGAVTNSKLLRIVAAVAFMFSITETMVNAQLFYYLKAVFSYGKDEYVQLMIIAGTSAFIAQMVVYPVLAHGIGERGVLWAGLLGASSMAYLYAFAWAAWVPYLGCWFGILSALCPAAMGTIVSRGVQADEQGKMQGVIVSVKTLANVIGPIILTPLTAAFLSDDPPFHFPGFTLMIGGTASVVGLLTSLSLPSLSTPDACFETVVPTAEDEISSGCRC